MGQNLAGSRKGLVDKKMERTMYTTFLASAFRSVRFGITEAHGRGVALQFNYLLDEGAFKVNDANGTFSVDPAKITDAVRKLTGELLTIEAEGSYEKAKAMLEKYPLILSRTSRWRVDHGVTQPHRPGEARLHFLPFFQRRGLRLDVGLSDAGILKNNGKY